MTPDEEAARQKRIVEAGLDAERIYMLMVEDEDLGIELLRSLLRMSAAVTELLTQHNRESEVTP